jgi:hypothetical protein
MTEEEADALDEYYTENPPTPGPNGTGYFSQRFGNVAHIIGISNASAAYLRSKAFATHKTPSELVQDMIQREIAAAS